MCPPNNNFLRLDLYFSPIAEHTVSQTIKSEGLQKNQSFVTIWNMWLFLSSFFSFEFLSSTIHNFDPRQMYHSTQIIVGNHCLTLRLESFRYLRKKNVINSQCENFRNFLSLIFVTQENSKPQKWQKWYFLNF